MKAVVTGATGFIGQELCAELENPAIMTRRPQSVPAALSGARAFSWDPMFGPPSAEAFEGADTVFHLAGEPVAEGRWTAAKKEAIRQSRIIGTRNLVEGLAPLERKPRVLVCASAVGYYGTREDDIVTEASQPGQGFLADVCRDWEAEAARAEEHDIRAVSIRIGLVLGKRGGALQKILPIFRLCAGGPLGNGKQWMAWVHVEDLVELILHAARNDQMRGVFNGVAPNPVTNTVFTRALANAVHRPAIFPAPAFALKLALGQFAEVLLASQRVLPEAVERTGFRYKYPGIDAALAECVS